MTQPTNAQMFFRPTVPLQPASQINAKPVPVIKPRPTMPWMHTRPPTSSQQTSYMNFKTVQTSTESHSQPFQQTLQQTQTWKPYKPTNHSGSTGVSNGSPAVAAVNIQSNVGFNEAVAGKSPRANGNTEKCPKMTAIKASRIKQNTSKKNDSEKIITEVLQETVYRQRELIGKLISVIVKDRLKTHDKTGELGLKDGDVSEVEKLLNFTGSLKSSKQSLKSDKNSPSNFSSGDRKRRTRTVTGEKKHICKRLRKDRKSPRQSFHAYRPNTSHNSNSVVATVSQPRSNDEKSQKVKDQHEIASPNPDPYDELVAAMSKKVLGLMHPDGDSRLFSLRMEFAQQLKSLEEEFQKEFEKKRIEKCVPEIYPSNQPHKNKQSDRLIGRDEMSGDSDWLPSSAASTSTTNKRSISLSSEPSSESFSLAKKKFPKRKHVRCYKPQQRYKNHPFRSKANNPSCFKPVAPRRASGMAMQKIDRMLRHPETDDASSSIDRARNFHERALEKIRQSMALWNKMSSEMSLYFFSNLPKNSPSPDVTKNENHTTKNDDACFQKEVVNNETFPEKKPPIIEEKQKSEENVAMLPSNKADPSFMLSKFLQFLPDHNETKDYATDGDDVVIQCDVEEVSEEEKNLHQHRCSANQSFSEIESKSRDVFKEQVQTCNDDDDTQSTNQSASFYCNLNQPEVSDPDIIGEVIIVTTDNTLQNEESNHQENQTLAGEVKVEEDIEEEKFVTKLKVAESCQESISLARKFNLEVNSDEFLDKLSEDREALTPSAIADRLKRHEESAFCSEGEDLPKIDFKRQKSVRGSQPRMQMFRALNSENKRSAPRSTSSPSKLCITKVMSLTEKAADSRNNNSTKSKKDNAKSKDKKDSKQTKPGVDTVQISSAKEDEQKKEEPRFTSSFLFENEKDLARPLKKLISDITLNKKSEDPGVIEWGLVPRKAMHLAKQRIQKQLCGCEKDDDLPLPPPERRSSLRSNVGLTPSGDCADSEAKRQEKRRFNQKKGIYVEDGRCHSNSASNVVTLKP